MKLRIITECKGQKIGGLSRYERSIIEYMKGKIDFEVTDVSQIKKSGRLKQISNLLFSYKKIKKNKEIIHLMNQQLALLLIFVKMQNVVVTVHDLTFIFSKYIKHFPFADKIRYKFVRRGLKRAGRIIVDAPFTKKDVIKYLKIHPKKIDIVPLGIDHSLFRVKKLGKKREEYRHYPGSHIILYVGSEITRMNFPILIRAFHALKKKLPSVKLIKVGKSNYPGERKKNLSLIEKLGITNDIKFIDHVSEEDLVNYYNSADVFVYPIEYTGFGLPPLEAMACGCPVISSNGSCLPEVMGNAALLFNPNSVSQLTERMYKLLTDKRLKKNLSRKGLKHSKIFTWEKCAKETIEVYKKFIKDIESR